MLIVKVNYYIPHTRIGNALVVPVSLSVCVCVYVCVCVCVYVCVCVSVRVSVKGAINFVVVLIETLFNFFSVIRHHFVEPLVLSVSDFG